MSTNNGSSVERHGMPEGLSDEEQQKWVYDRNCETVAAATEDMHHRNLARMVLLKERQGLEVTEADLLGMKMEILLDLFVGDNELQRNHVGFVFQQRLADHLATLETSKEQPDA